MSLNLKILVLFLSVLLLFGSFSYVYAGHGDCSGEDCGAYCDGQFYCVDQPSDGFSEGGHECTPEPEICGGSGGSSGTDNPDDEPLPEDEPNQGDEPFDAAQDECAPVYVGYPACFGEGNESRVCEVFDNPCEDGFEPITKDAQCRVPEAGECGQSIHEEADNQPESDESKESDESEVPVEEQLLPEDEQQARRDQSYESECDPDADGPDPSSGWQYLGSSCDPDNQGNRGQEWFCKGTTRFAQDRADDSCGADASFPKTDEACQAEFGPTVYQCNESNQCLAISSVADGESCTESTRRVSVNNCEEENFCEIDPEAEEPFDATQGEPEAVEGGQCDEEDYYRCVKDECIHFQRDESCQLDPVTVDLEFCPNSCQDLPSDDAFRASVRDLEQVCKFRTPTKFFCNEDNTCTKKQAKADESENTCGEEEVETSKEELASCPKECSAEGAEKIAKTVEEILSGKDAVCKREAGDPIFYCDAKVCIKKWQGFAPDKGQCIDTFVTANKSEIPEGSCLNNCQDNEASSGLVTENQTCEFKDPTEYKCSQENTCIALVSVAEKGVCLKKERVINGFDIKCPTECRVAVPASIKPQVKPAETAACPNYVQACDGGETFQACEATRDKDGKCSYKPGTACSSCTKDPPDVSINNKENKCEVGVCINKPGPVCVTDDKCADTKPGASCSFPTTQDCAAGETRACRGEINAKGVCEYKDVGSGASCTACTTKPIVYNENAFCHEGACVNGPGKVCLTNKDCPQPPPPQRVAASISGSSYCYARVNCEVKGEAGDEYLTGYALKYWTGKTPDGNPVDCTNLAPGRVFAPSSCPPDEPPSARREDLTGEKANAANPLQGWAESIGRTSSACVPGAVYCDAEGYINDVSGCIERKLLPSCEGQAKRVIAQNKVSEIYGNNVSLKHLEACNQLAKDQGLELNKQLKCDDGGNVIDPLGCLPPNPSASCQKQAALEGTLKGPFCSEQNFCNPIAPNSINIGFNCSVSYDNDDQECSTKYFTDPRVTQCQGEDFKVGEWCDPNGPGKIIVRPDCQVGFKPDAECKTEYERNKAYQAIETNDRVYFGDCSVEQSCNSANGVISHTQYCLDKTVSTIIKKELDASRCVPEGGTVEAKNQAFASGAKEVDDFNNKSLPQLAGEISTAIGNEAVKNRIINTCRRSAVKPDTYSPDRPYSPYGIIDQDQLENCLRGNNIDPKELEVKPSPVPPPDLNSTGESFFSMYLGSAETQKTCVELHQQLGQTLEARREGRDVVIGTNQGLQSQYDQMCVKDTRSAKEKSDKAAEVLRQTKSLPQALESMGILDQEKLGIEQAAAEFGLNIEAMDTWTDSQRQAFLLKLQTKNPNITKWLTEFLAAPLSTYENRQIAEDICVEKYGNGCLFLSQNKEILRKDPSEQKGILGILFGTSTDEDFEKLRQVGLQTYGSMPDPNLVSFDELRNYSLAVNTCRYYKKDDLLRECILRQPNISPDRVNELDEAFKSYASATVYGVGTTWEGKTLMGTAEAATNETYLNLILNTVDPSHVVKVASIGVKGAIIITAAAKAKLFSRFGREGAERIMGKAGAVVDDAAVRTGVRATGGGGERIRAEIVTSEADRLAAAGAVRVEAVVVPPGRIDIPPVPERSAVVPAQPALPPGLATPDLEPRGGRLGGTGEGTAATNKPVIKAVKPEVPAVADEVPPAVVAQAAPDRPAVAQAEPPASTRSGGDLLPQTGSVQAPGIRTAVAPAQVDGTIPSAPSRRNGAVGRTEVEGSRPAQTGITPFPATGTTPLVVEPPAPANTTRFAGSDVPATQLNAEGLQAIEQHFGGQIGRGAEGITYADRNKGILTKIFHGSGYKKDVAEPALELPTYKGLRFNIQNGGKYNIPEFLGLVLDEAGNIRGFQQRFIPDSETFGDFISRGGKLSDDEYQEALDNLRRIHADSKASLGDLINEGNVLIQTVEVDGKQVHKVWFIDVGSASSNKAVHIADEFRQFSDWLKKHTNVPDETTFVPVAEAPSRRNRAVVRAERDSGTTTAVVEPPKPAEPLGRESAGLSDSYRDPADYYKARDEAVAGIPERTISRAKGNLGQKIEPRSGGGTVGAEYYLNSNNKFTKLVADTPENREAILAEAAALQLASETGATPKPVIYHTRDGKIGIQMDYLPKSLGEEIRQGESFTSDKRLATVEVVGKYHDGVGRAHGDLRDNLGEHIRVDQTGERKLIDPVNTRSNINITPEAEARQTINDLFGDLQGRPVEPNFTTINLPKTEAQRAFGARVIDELETGKSLSQAIEAAKKTPEYKRMILEEGGIPRPPAEVPATEHKTGATGTTSRSSSGSTQDQTVKGDNKAFVAQKLADPKYKAAPVDKDTKLVVAMDQSGRLKDIPNDSFGEILPLGETKVTLQVRRSGDGAIYVASADFHRGLKSKNRVVATEAINDVNPTIFGQKRNVIVQTSYNSDVYLTNLVDTQIGDSFSSLGTRVENKQLGLDNVLIFRNDSSYNNWFSVVDPEGKADFNDALAKLQQANPNLKLEPLYKIYDRSGREIGWKIGYRDLSTLTFLERSELRAREFLEGRFGLKFDWFDQARIRLEQNKFLKERGLTRDSIVYRYTDEEFIQDGFALGNSGSVALVIDHFNPIRDGTWSTPRAVTAYELGVPTLNVAQVDPVAYGSPNSVRIGVRVGDILDQGGRVYSDNSSTTIYGALIVSVPEGKVPVASIKKPAGEEIKLRGLDSLKGGSKFGFAGCDVKRVALETTYANVLALTNKTDCPLTQIAAVIPGPLGDLAENGARAADNLIPDRIAAPLADLERGIGNNIPGANLIETMDRRLLGGRLSRLTGDLILALDSSPLAQPLQRALYGLRNTWDNIRYPVKGIFNKEVPSFVQPEIRDVVNQVDELLTLEGNPKDLGCREGDCSYSSALVSRASEKAGIKADMYEVGSLHEAIDGKRIKVLGHTITILEKDNQRYLGDLTFNQFIRENGVIDSGRLLKDFPIIQELLDKGYVPLTDKNLRQYLKATAKLSVGNQYLSKIDRVTVDELLAKTKPLEQYYGQNFLDSRLARVSTPCPISQTSSNLASVNSNVLGVQTGCPFPGLFGEVQAVQERFNGWFRALIGRGSNPLTGGNFYYKRILAHYPQKLAQEVRKTEKGLSVIIIPAKVVRDLKSDFGERFGTVIGHGHKGTVYAKGNIATKIQMDNLFNNSFPSTDYETLVQIRALKLANGRGGLPKIYGVIKDSNGQILGYRMERISGVDLLEKEAVNQEYLTLEVRLKFLRDVADAYDVTGGSIHGLVGRRGGFDPADVMLEEISRPDGFASRRLRLIDYGMGPKEEIAGESKALIDKFFMGGGEPYVKATEETRKVGTMLLKNLEKGKSLRGALDGLPEEYRFLAPSDCLLSFTPLALAYATNSNVLGATIGPCPFGALAQGIGNNIPGANLIETMDRRLLGGRLSRLTGDLILALDSSPLAQPLQRALDRVQGVLNLRGLISRERPSGFRDFPLVYDPSEIGSGLIGRRFPEGGVGFEKELIRRNLDFTNPSVQFHPKYNVGQFKSNGLSVVISKYENSPYKDFHLAIPISKGSMIGQVDFLPLGTDYYPEGYKTITLAKGLQGLEDFLKYLEADYKKTGLPEPRYLVGKTNPRMAEFAERLGFKIVGEDNGELFIFADLASVRVNAEKMRPLLPNLRRRAEKEIAIILQRGVDNTVSGIPCAVSISQTLTDLAQNDSNPVKPDSNVLGATFKGGCVTTLAARGVDLARNIPGGGVVVGAGRVLDRVTGLGSRVAGVLDQIPAASRFAQGVLDGTNNARDFIRSIPKTINEILSPNPPGSKLSSIEELNRVRVLTAWPGDFNYLPGGPLPIRGGEDVAYLKVVTDLKKKGISEFEKLRRLLPVHEDFIKAVLSEKFKWDSIEEILERFRNGDPEVLYKVAEEFRKATHKEFTGIVQESVERNILDGLKLNSKEAREELRTILQGDNATVFRVINEINKTRGIPAEDWVAWREKVNEMSWEDLAKGKTVDLQGLKGTKADEVRTLVPTKVQEDPFVPVYNALQAATNLPAFATRELSDLVRNPKPLDEAFAEMFGITPQKALPPSSYATPEEVNNLKETISKRGISYEPNLLSYADVRSLTAKIDQVIAQTTDKEALDDLKALKDFIDKNGFIFTEFSQGTNSISIRGILDHGLLPKSQIPEGTKAYRGEGRSVNPDRVNIQSISAGLGQDGLGVAIAYARLSEDPLYLRNPDIDTKLVRLVSPPGEKPEDYLSNAYQDYIDRRRKAYQEAYKKLLTERPYYRRQYEEQYPVVVGFTGTGQAPDVLSREYFAGGDDYLVGEVQFYKGDKSLPGQIRVMAAPKRGIEALKAILKEQGREDIAVISFEALDQLPELGITSIKHRDEYIYNFGVINGEYRVLELDWRYLELQKSQTYLFFSKPIVANLGLVM